MVFENIFFENGEDAKPAQTLPKMLAAPAPRLPSSVAPSSSVPRLLARPIPTRVARTGLLMRGRLDCRDY